MKNVQWNRQRTQPDANVFGVSRNLILFEKGAGDVHVSTGNRINKIRMRHGLYVGRSKPFEADENTR